MWPFFRGRDQGRTPMQWDDSAGGGFTCGEPWLPLHEDFQKVNVENEKVDDNSIWNTYRKMIELRKTLPALQQGKIEFTETGRNGVLAYIRTLDNQQIQITLNFSARKQKFPCFHDNHKLLLSTCRKEPDKMENMLHPFEAVVSIIDNPTSL